MDFDRRGLVDPQHTIVVVITLDDLPLNNVDLAPQGRREAEDQSAFDLTDHAIGVDSLSTIHGGRDAMQHDIAVRRYLRIDNAR